MKFFRDVLGTFTTEIAIVGLNFSIGVLFARLLPPTDRGILALVLLLPVTLAYFADLGVSQAIVYLLGRKKRSLEAVAGTTLALALLLGGVAALVMWLARAWILPAFFKSVPSSYYLFALGLLPVLLLDTYLLSILRGQQRFAVFNFRRLLTPVFLLAGVIFLTGVGGLGVRGAVIAFAISTLLGLLLSFWFVGYSVAHTSETSLRLRFQPSLAGEAVAFGLKSYAQNLVGHLHYRLDVYLLALFLPPAQVAFYAIATAVAEVAFYLPDSVGTVLFPKLSAEREERIHELTAEVSRHTLWITALATLGLLAAGGWLIPLAYGQAYRPAIAPFMVLMPGCLAMAVYKILTRNFTSRNRQQVSILAASVSLVSNIALNILLIPRMGVIGAALASLISYTTAATILALIFRRETGIPLKQILIIRRADLSRYAEAWSQISRRSRIGLKVEG